MTAYLYYVIATYFAVASPAKATLACVANRDAGAIQIGQAVEWACGQASGLACVGMPATCNDTFSVADWVFSSYYILATSPTTTIRSASTSISLEVQTPITSTSTSGTVAAAQVDTVAVTTSVQTTSVQTTSVQTTSVQTTSVQTTSAQTTRARSTTTMMAVAPINDECCCIAQAGSECHKDVMWAMETGVHENADWYPDLNASSSFVAFQTLLFQQGSSNCAAPCDAEVQTTTQLVTSEDACHFGGAALLQNTSRGNLTGPVCVKAAPDDLETSTSTTAEIQTSANDPDTSTSTTAELQTSIQDIASLTSTSSEVIITTQTTTTAAAAVITGSLIMQAIQALQFMEDGDVESAVLRSLASFLGSEDLVSIVEAEFTLSPGRRMNDGADRVRADYSVTIDASLCKDLDHLMSALKGMTPSEMTTKLQLALASIPGRFDYLVNVIDMIEPTVIMHTADCNARDGMTSSTRGSMRWADLAVALACSLGFLLT